MRSASRSVACLRLLIAVLVLGVLPVTSHAEEYASSVVGTDFDFIQESDPSAFLCLEFKFRGTREMPDKRGPTPLFQDAFVFVAYYEDGTSVDIALDIDFETEDAARAEAMRYAPRLGRLPTSLRRGVKRLVVHQGGPSTTAFSDIGLIVVYSENATKRIGTHDLEETLFHESVHAAWDKAHAGSKAWRDAQTADGVFITKYAKRLPEGEDLAESALFAYTLVHHPERIPADHAKRIRKAIPNRIAFVRDLLPPDKPIFFEVGPKYACDGSGTTFTVKGRNPDPLPMVEPEEAEAEDACEVDLTLVGMMSDLLSNALMHGLDQDAERVTAYLTKAKAEIRTSSDLLEATATEFGIDRSVLKAAVREYLHCNCEHEPLSGGDASVPGIELLDVNPAKAETETSTPAAREPEGNAIEPLLYAIAALLLVLLIVNVISLAVQLKRPKA
ncbi:MAG: hypothetical protein QNJ98_15755 [Planctomycetota bacterium]|nr:hypothetical protein [Planctomycetota bacterium]